MATMARWRGAGPLGPGDPRDIAGFEVVGRLGEGGMGVVFLAEHAEHGRAALKFVRTGGDDTAFRERFRREVEAARRVHGPRVARVLAADPDAGVPWLATAFVDGPTLHEAVAETGPLAGERLQALALALLDALAVIHEAGVVHRDLKPSNILLTPETPVVIDFGIASLHEAPSLTRTGTAVGTPGWMAPEQVQGRPCGPAADVFSWASVVAFAGSSRPPFGDGPADARCYRVVHEDPVLPDLPDPLAMLVRAALAKDPAGRPDVGTLLARLTGRPVEATVLGPTLADRTAVVPTFVALGWDVEALPSRPDGRARAVPRGHPPDPGVDAAFWYAGEDHRDLRSLAAAFQAHWEDAAGQVFRGRDPIWLGELRGFLEAHGADEAASLVAAGGGDSPPSASLARLVLAMDAGIDPRVGTIVLTPDGLEAAARVVTGAGGVAALASAAPARVAGGRPAAPERARTAERLADIGSSRILRLWRGLPGMERAAAVDERWHAGLQAFGSLVASVAPHAGWPSPEESHRAAASLLLCAVHPEHERQLDRRLAAARRTSARHQTWWARLAAEGQRNPPAAVLAVLTAERARSVTIEQRRAAKAAGQRHRDAARQGREADRARERERRAVAAAARPRFVPIRRALCSATGAWGLALLVVGLVGFLWVDARFADDLVALEELAAARGDAGAADRLRAAEDASAATGWAVVVLVALPVMHVVTRVLMAKGARRAGVRLYAAAAGVVDLAVGLALVPAATLAALVLRAGVDARIDPNTPSPFAGDAWAAAALLVPYGLVGAYLAVRAVWRLGRVVLGHPLAGPFLGRGVPAWR